MPTVTPPYTSSTTPPRSHTYNFHDRVKQVAKAVFYVSLAVFSGVCFPSPFDIFVPLGILTIALISWDRVSSISDRFSSAFSRAAETSAHRQGFWRHRWNTQSQPSTAYVFVGPQPHNHSRSRTPPRWDQVPQTTTFTPRERTRIGEREVYNSGARAYVPPRNTETQDSSEGVFTPGERTRIGTRT